jgi:ribosomal-protein-alanine N-acetyltransferase
MHNSEFSELSTERLRLEPFAHSHSDGVFSLWSSPEVCRLSGEAHDWQGRPIHLPARSPIDSNKILDFFIRRAAEGSGIRWAVISKRSDQCIGAVGLNSIAPTAELAYHLHPDHWGSGYATEACTAVLEWCRLNLPGVAIDAFIEAENVASTRLAKRLGFEETTALREGARRYVHSES